MNPVIRNLLFFEKKQLLFHKPPVCINLITFGRNFVDASWTKTAVNTPNNAVIAPDGSFTGQSLVPNTAAGASHLIGESTSANGIYTFSFYAKAGLYPCVGASNNPNNYVFFDLINGTISSLGTGWGLATMTPAGKGWYRCTVTNAGSQAWVNVYIYVINIAITDGNDGSGQRAFTANGTSGTYIWGAQLEIGTIASPYRF